ncbi:MAG: DUF1512 family protein [Candidatus Aenigmarchaeota archaeon]|nr:DUF1512 family protein [Candidatus Aenigmarchaeota archaeon]
MIPGLGGNGEIIGQVVWFGFFILFIIFGPKLMITQTIMKIEKDVIELENYAKEANEYLKKHLSSKTSKKGKKDIQDFMDFFMVPPINADPYGLMNKLDHMIKNSDRRFKYIVEQVIPKASETEKMNLKNGIAGAMQTYQIAKIVRHYLETIKKYKMFQMAIIIQMQIPMIKEIAKASKEATKAFLDGIPIGDSIGPLVIASLTKDKVTEFKNEEFAVSKTKINGKTVYLSKALGPGATTGSPGKFLQKVFNKYKIGKMITVDASLKLEGEKTGSIAEGIGVAMGGIGVERYAIEDIAVKKNIPLDAIAVKMSQEEALIHMKTDIMKAVPNAIDAIEAAVKSYKGKGNIMIMGVGNTSGVGNTVKDADTARITIKKTAKELDKGKKKK